jgi:hypothetical protein
MSYKKRDLLSPLQGRKTLRTFDKSRPTPHLMQPTLSQSLLLYNENHQDLSNMLNQAEAMLKLLTHHRTNTWTPPLRDNYLQEVTTLIHKINSLNHTQWQQHLSISQHLSETDISPQETSNDSHEVALGACDTGTNPNLKSD